MLDTIGEILVVIAIVVAFLAGVAGLIFFVGLVGLGTITVITIPASAVAPNINEFVGIANLGEMWAFFNTWSGFGISFAVGLVSFIWAALALRALYLPIALKYAGRLAKRE